MRQCYRILFYVSYHFNDVSIYILSQLILYANLIVGDLFPRRALFRLLYRFEIEFARSLVRDEPGQKLEEMRSVLVVETIHLYFFDTCRNNRIASVVNDWERRRAIVVLYTSIRMFRDCTLHCTLKTVYRNGRRNY